MATFTTEEAYAFLDSHPGTGWAVLSSNGRDGYPHTVPLGYFRRGEEVFLNARGQRVANVRRDPRVAVLVEDGIEMRELRGVLIRGDAEVVDDPAAVLDLSREALRLRGTAEADLPTEVRPGSAYIRVQPRTITSWDNTRR
ncbi:MAG: pyridoxamine 5'-phosphate oxidase family protein [Chloroflexi bacterium]|nr:pyridoxamine 5'-phosphate oxidase family protein [Chloroflexota bacterium]